MHVCLILRVRLLVLFSSACSLPQLIACCPPLPPLLQLIEQEMKETLRTAANVHVTHRRLLPEALTARNGSPLDVCITTTSRNQMQGEVHDTLARLVYGWTLRHQRSDGMRVYEAPNAPGAAWCPFCLLHARPACVPPLAAVICVGLGDWVLMHAQAILGCITSYAVWARLLSTPDLQPWFACPAAAGQWDVAPPAQGLRVLELGFYRAFADIMDHVRSSLGAPTSVTVYSGPMPPLPLCRAR